MNERGLPVVKDRVNQIPYLKRRDISIKMKFWPRLERWNRRSPV
jgi:hypothetical protein